MHKACSLQSYYWNMHEVGVDFTHCPHSAVGNMVRLHRSLAESYSNITMITTCLQCHFIFKLLLVHPQFCNFVVYTYCTWTNSSGKTRTWAHVPFVTHAQIHTTHPQTGSYHWKSPLTMNAEPNSTGTEWHNAPILIPSLLHLRFLFSKLY